MREPAPALTVIIASALPLDGAPACLGSIVRQAHGRPVEILLACDAGGGAGPVAGLPGPEVIRPASAVTLPRLLGMAVARARGAIIAVTDPTCAVGDGWVSAILRAHEAPSPVIGGAVEPEGLRRLVDWAAYFSEYGAFMLPLAEGAIDQVPGINFSVKRAALERGREFVDGEFWKAYWCRQLQAEGVELDATPTVVVYYRKSFRLWPFLARRFHHGRCFAGMRLRQLTPVQRALYFAGSPLLPLLFGGRLVRTVLRKRRHRREFWLASPLIVLALLSWAAGECCGYLLGPGTGCHHVR